MKSHNIAKFKYKEMFPNIIFYSHQTNESKLKNSLKHKNKKYSKKSIEKRTKTILEKHSNPNYIHPLIGHKQSKEICEKKRLSHIGLKHSEETKRKMSESQKGLKRDYGLKSRKGKTLEEIYGIEGAKKMREYRRKQVLPFKDTKIEVKIQNYLKELGIDFFTHQYIKEIKHGYQCDIFIPKFNMIIECDGDYWHKIPTRIMRDTIRTEELIEKGFKVLRLWGSEINVMTINDFKDKLKEKIGDFYG